MAANWDDVENYARAIGIPVEDAAKRLGVAMDKATQPSVDALTKMYQNQMAPSQPPTAPSGPPPDPSRNDATLANQGAYEQQLSDRLKAIATQDPSQPHQPLIENPDLNATYAMGGDVPDNNNDVAGGGYTQYAMGGDVDLKPKFSHLEDMIKKHKKAGSELEASRNPQKFMEKMKNPSIKGLRGIAMNRGGKVK